MIPLNPQNRDHHLDMHVASQDYLSFSWKTANKVNYYIFTCLPFGLSSACYIFTKVVRPLVKFWRSKGFLIVLYLDDDTRVSNKI